MKTLRCPLALLVILACSACDFGGEVSLNGDLVGVRVLSTGQLGDKALRVEISGEEEVTLTAGTFFEPKPAWDAGEEQAPPQRLMLAEDYVLQGPGTFLLDAYCMDHGRAAPDRDAEYYSSPREPSTAQEECQRDCAGDQDCIWGCDGTPKWLAELFKSGLDKTHDDPADGDDAGETSTEYGSGQTSPYEQTNDSDDYDDRWLTPLSDDQPDDDTEPYQPPATGNDQHASEAWTEGEVEIYEESASEADCQELIRLWVGDACDDSESPRFRIFDLTSGQVWPDSGSFATQGYGVQTIVTLACTSANELCVGGDADGVPFGVGLNGTGETSNYWCLSCGITSLQGWSLGCE